MFVLTNPRPDRSLTSAKHLLEFFKECFKTQIRSFVFKDFQHTNLQLLSFDIDTTYPGGWRGSMVFLVKNPFLPLSPLELTLTSNPQNCPNLQQITSVESVANLLSPLKLTLTKNAAVSPLELTLTKSRAFKSHRITFLQKGGSGRTRVASVQALAVGITSAEFLARFCPRPKIRGNPTGPRPLRESSSHSAAT
jgi:hypothetical protein